jgi:hypothetical protein
VPATGRLVYVYQVPWGFLDCVFQVQGIQRVVVRKVLHLQVDNLDVSGGLGKAFVLDDCPYCNIRLAGLGQDDLRVRELSGDG